MRSSFIALIALLLSATGARAQLQEHQLQFEEPRATTPFDGPRTSHQAVATDDCIYVVGGYRWEKDHGVFFPHAQIAHIERDGSIRKWLRSTEMTAARSGLGAAIAKGVLYAAGGSNDQWQSLDSVEYAQMLPDGSLGAWSSSSHRLNVARSNFTLVSHQLKNGGTVLYAIGGVGQVGVSTVHFDSIEYASILPNGDTSEWRRAAYDMKGGRSTPAAFIHADRLYICGGWGDRNFDDVFDDIQFAPITEDGDLAPWQTSPYEMRMRLYGHTTSVVSNATGTFAVTLGGSLGEGNVIPFIQYGLMQEDGAVGPWTMAQKQLMGARWGHSTAISKSRLYVTGGANGADFLNDVQIVEPSTAQTSRIKESE